MVSTTHSPAPNSKLAGTEEELNQEHKAGLDRASEDEGLHRLSLAMGGLAHDFNNFLTGILGSTALLLRQLPSDAASRPLAQEIERSALQATELTRKILDYAGRGELVAESVDLTSLLRGMARLLETSTPATVQLLWRLDDSLPTLYGEADGMRQLVVQLVMNAADALEGNRGYISLATGVQHLDVEDLDALRVGHGMDPGRYAFLEVSDTGCGMEASLQRQIFDPFFSTKTAARGLGLTWALGVVRKHGGGIWLDSAPASGSTFRVYFPLARPAVGVAEPEPRVESTGATESQERIQSCVLVVDDEHFVRTVTQGILEDGGFATLGASDGLSALEIYGEREKEIDLVLLDVTMPGMDGHETLRELRRLSPGVKVILTSGYSAESPVKNLSEEPHAEVNASLFLRKPYRPQQLIEAVQRVLG